MERDWSHLVQGGVRKCAIELYIHVVWLHIFMHMGGRVGCTVRPAKVLVRV